MPLFKTNTLGIHPRTQVPWSTPIFGGVEVLVSTCIQKMMAINHFLGGGGKVGKNTPRSLHAAWAFGKSYINSFLTI